MSYKINTSSLFSYKARLLKSLNYIVSNLRILEIYILMSYILLFPTVIQKLTVCNTHPASKVYGRSRGYALIMQYCSAHLGGGGGVIF